MMPDNSYFFDYMKGLLGSRYADFVNAYENKPRHKALRVNTRKISAENFAQEFVSAIKPNPLCVQSFYCNVKPSLDPLYHAGLYYMQEPSASAAVAAFRSFIGRRVLDLCAAPGGKSTQAADCMNGGVIFCNDPEFKRTRALAENIERLGIVNAAVTCNTASDYRAAGFDGYFDTLIVDAPCSGGGMMRYESVPYSADIVSGCASRQRAILADAAHLLCDGGYMLYSTCTFAKEENEDNVQYLRGLGFTPVDIPISEYEERGIDIPEARRVYPMNFDGEGHFYCVLKKTGGSADGCALEPIRKKRGAVRFNDLTLDTVTIGKRVILPIELPELDGLNIVRCGVPVFDADEPKTPSHALIHALSRADTEKLGAVELGDAADAYIRGEQLGISAPRGLLVATVRGHALGLVKSAPSGDGTNVLKNKYPRGLRVKP